MTMMMMDANDDDEGWGVNASPFTRSDLDMWCQADAGLIYRRWPGWAPAGALANLIRRGADHVGALRNSRPSFVLLELMWASSWPTAVGQGQAEN